MLYDLHEWHHALIEPWHALARTNHELFSHPFSPLSYHPLADRVTASADLMQRLTRRYEKPTFRLTRTEIRGAEVAVAERAVLRLISVPLTDGQFDALVSFTYNLGGQDLNLRPSGHEPDCRS